MATNGVGQNINTQISQSFTSRVRANVSSISSKFNPCEKSDHPPRKLRTPLLSVSMQAKANIAYAKRGDAEFGVDRRVDLGRIHSSVFERGKTLSEGGDKDQTIQDLKNKQVSRFKALGSRTMGILNYCVTSARIPLLTVGNFLMSLAGKQTDNQEDIKEIKAKRSENFQKSKEYSEQNKQVKDDIVALETYNMLTSQFNMKTTQDTTLSNEKIIEFCKNNKIKNPNQEEGVTRNINSTLTAVENIAGKLAQNIMNANTPNNRREAIKEAKLLISQNNQDSILSRTFYKTLGEELGAQNKNSTLVTDEKEQEQHFQRITQIQGEFTNNKVFSDSFNQASKKTDTPPTENT